MVDLYFTGATSNPKWGQHYQEPTDNFYTQQKSSNGKSSQFLDSRGFGWLMEVDDDDDDSQKPLL